MSGSLPPARPLEPLTKSKFRYKTREPALADYLAPDFLEIERRHLGEPARLPPPRVNDDRRADAVAESQAPRARNPVRRHEARARDLFFQREENLLAAHLTARDAR